MSQSLSVGTPGLETTASRSRARSSVAMPAEASALCRALRRVGDDLAVVRFEAPAILASQALTSSGASAYRARMALEGPWGHGRCHPNHGRSRHRRCDHPRSSTGTAERVMATMLGVQERQARNVAERLGGRRIGRVLVVEREIVRLEAIRRQREGGLGDG
jgi:hypothetical protein